MTEKLKIPSDVCSKLIADFKVSIIWDNALPYKWNVSIIISLFKGKVKALDRLNYHDLNLTERILKVIEQIIECFIYNIVKIDDTQFGFLPGCGTTGSIFIVHKSRKHTLGKIGIYYLLLLICK